MDRKPSLVVALAVALALLTSCASDDEPGGGPGDDGGSGRDGGPRGDGGSNGPDGSSGSPDAGDPLANWSSANATLEAQVLVLVNQRRAAGATCGTTAFPPAPALATDARLTAAARAHSYDMVARSFFDHTNPDGDSPFDRMTARGYDWSHAGENIAVGQTTAADVMDTWMNSEGHCSNIMSPDFEDIGIGFYMNRWTQVFGAQ